jgi:hypothetical protein
MRLAKLFATAFCGGVIAFQLYAILSPLRHRNAYLNHYWPFLNYPMYSDAHRLGESLSSLALWAVPCGTGAKPVPVSSAELRVKWGPFTRLLSQAANIPSGRRTIPPEVVEAAARQLGHFVATRLAIPVCTVQVWRRTYTITHEGFEHADTTWHVAAEWPLTRADSIATEVSDRQLP